jgi:cyclic beta-1,2-glucan synthetase
VTNSTDGSTRENAPKSIGLVADAQALAEGQRELQRVTRSTAGLYQASAAGRALAHAQKHLASTPPADATLNKAADWFLDNYYLVRRVARQIKEDLPPGFVRHLPELSSGPEKGRLRIDGLARAFVLRAGLELDAAVLRDFVDAYQEVTPLTIAELWALPTMLRASAVSHLLGFLDDLHVPVRAEGDRDRLASPRSAAAADEGRVASLALDPRTGVERCVRALRLLDAIDWKTFFERTNRVEAILRNDPADVYARMDFETCDSYRKVVEALAWSTAMPEEGVAELAVVLARESAPDERRGHVGHYLLGGGRSVLEQRIGYRAVGLEWIRRALTRWPTISYLLPLAVLTLCPLVGSGWYLFRHGAHLFALAVAMTVAAVPVSVVAVTALQRALAHLLPPRTLPKLDFAKGLRDEARTLVVIPTLLGRTQDVDGMIRQVELHYLSNPDPNIQFAILTDDVDGKAMPDSEALLESAARGIAALNGKHGLEGCGPFHLLHREPRWNPGEERFMGWERKRGKLEELNRLLRGDKGTSYARHVGDPKGLLGIRFVITLDSDTQLPMGGARRMVGVLAHPLNQAVFEPSTGRVVAGFTIVQPRIETSPSSSRQTRFSRIFAGDIGFDIYTHAVSELYQDLFGSGIYVGKGIYDVDAFMRSVEGRAPENALVSHDLFEGVHGRTALATDIVLFEGYPSNYAAYAKRMHRWVRGDWQLLPWLFPVVPSAGTDRVRNTLAGIDRWKIFDNLRRSLASPLLLLLLVLGWSWLPGSALSWTLGALAVLLAPLLPALAGGRRMRLENLGRCALAIAFLAYEAWVVLDAIVRVIVRTAITRKHLLQWTSAAQTAFGIAAKSPRAVFWRTMAASPILAAVIGAVVAWSRPSALPIAAPFLFIWLVAPEIARWVSEPLSDRHEQLRPEDRKKLRLLARRTWRFFDAFVGPNDQWLPVDNYQEEPREQTAHRTSPTNIGLMLIATLSAFDFGYIGPSELSLRVRRAFETITRLPHYQGHLLNWYDTRNLQPLLPRYVSTVDSGNFAGCLVALKQGCRELAVAPVVRAQAWEGVGDSIDLLDEVLDAVPDAAVKSLRAVIARMRRLVERGRDEPEDTFATIRTLCDDTSPELDRELLEALETGAHRYEADVLHALRTSSERLRQQFQQMRRELETLLPWLALKEEAAGHAIALPTALRLDEIPDTSIRLRAELDAWQGQRRERGEVTPAIESFVSRLTQALQTAEANATTLRVELMALADRAEAEVRGMDFRLLYDAERKLFHIGYNATIDQIDSHHYDLLASEARLASYLAIVKRDVPESHWYTLGRPMTRTPRGPALLSWGGTMFEYLMPALLMRSRQGTLLARTNAIVVDAQIAYAASRNEPWGISESAYARTDAQQTYQYRSFGVPGLGFKRGLEDDRVVAPYASMLAVSIRPRAVVDNVARLISMGMCGTYGLFEALDLTPERVPEGRPFAIVRSYMAHHQGMLMVALGNVLNDEIMIDRFHSDASVETGELLLNEHSPDVVPPEWPIGEGAEGAGVVRTVATPRPPAPWSPDEQNRPQAFVLSNGRLTSLLTDSAGGGLEWQGLALTRYEPDASRDDGGLWTYLRDEDSGRVWLATSAEGRTTFAMHKAEFHLREGGISVHVDVTVAPADDVEVRHITLRNETDQPRRLTVTTAGRPVLLDAEQARSHPAFSSLFVESERLVSLDGLLFARRPQSPKEERAVLVHRLVREGAAVTFVGYETDRAAFFGRCAGRNAPASLAAGSGWLRGRVGPVLDPVMSLMAGVELRPKGSATLAFVTAVGRSRRVAVELAQRYGSMHAVRWAFRDAEQESSRRLTRTTLDPALLPSVQRLFSALLFADPALRAASPRARAARPCKRRLWARGISGDEAILLVRVEDTGAPLVREVLAAQRYLRSCGARFDLVLVDEQPSGYLSDGAGTLGALLKEDTTEDWLNRRGGVFLIAADQISDGELGHLEASARVVLDTRDGSLARRLERPSESPPKLPRFEPTLADDPAERRPVRPALLFDNGSGGFTLDGREYVISVPAGTSTPAPWCNVLANPEFGCLVSESSLGATWSLNSGENRLTPWRNDPVSDTPSEVVYLRDEETGAVWSPTPLPAGQQGESLVRHGAGYTIYERANRGLEQTLSVFVPPDAPLKVVRLRIENTLSRRRRLTVTYYAEWVLGSRRVEQRPYIVSEFDRDHGCLLASCAWNAEFGDRVAFVASKNDVHGFTSDRTEFLGRRGDYARPEALERWGLSGSLVAGVDPCAALQVHVELAPGEVLETHFVVGQAASRIEAVQLVARFRDPGVVNQAWLAVGEFWDGILGAVRVSTPEPAMDLMLNRWLLYQTLSCRVFGRTGFYQSSGAFGYRDQLQDVMALLHAAPERARSHILEAAAHQFDAGDVLHWWHPPSGRGVRTRCSDDMAWLPFVTAEYVAATGDASILHEPVAFLIGDPLRPDEHDRYAQYETSPTSAPLMEHCRRALERALTAGSHGLPLMGDGDWNDGMNRVGAEGRGESVWLGWFLCVTMDRFAALSARVHDMSEASAWRARADSLRATVQASSWDGAWYLRAFHDDGSLVGSSKNRECRIDSIAQSWAALAGPARGEREMGRARAAVHAADDRLVRGADRLVLLFWPAYDGTLHDPGYVRAYPPGIRENAGQYTHAATWLGWAHAALGEGELAERIFRLLNPVLRTGTAADSARYRVEPYALAGDIYSCPPWVGRGGWTWYTGAAAWMWRLGVEAILGLRRQEGQLRIDPCIPPAWKGFEAWIRVGRRSVHVVVDNPEGVATGVAAITLDGRPLDSNRVPVDPTGVGSHEVRVRLGTPARRAAVDTPDVACFKPPSGFPAG